MNDDMLRGILGDEFGDQIFRKAIPVITPAPIPVVAGHIPSTRPKGSTPDKRKEEIKQLVEQSLAQAGYNEEALTGLIEAMARYVENQVG